MIVLPHEVANVPTFHLPTGFGIDTDLLVRGMPLGGLGATTCKLKNIGMNTPRHFHERSVPLLRTVQFGRTSWARVCESLREAGFRLDDFPCLQEITFRQMYTQPKIRG